MLVRLNKLIEGSQAISKSLDRTTYPIQYSQHQNGETMGLRTPTPNRGQSVEDYMVDNDTVTQDALRQSFKIDPTKQVRLVKLLFVKYQHPDLQVITNYLHSKY